MTWGEFKAAVAAAGVTDDTLIGVVDFGGSARKLSVEMYEGVALVFGDWSVGDFKREDV